MKFNKLLLVFAIIMANQLFSQDKEDENKESAYKFTDVVRLKTTSVKNQNRAGTCWSYSTIAFLESEIVRMGKGEYDLSEMWIVRNAYHDKAEKYVRLHGVLNFGQGGAAHDVTAMIGKYGIVPQEIYQGLNYGTEKDVHGELDAVLKGMLDAVIKNKNKKVTPVWLTAYDKVLDTYFGEKPEKFTYNGKEYTPISFAEELGLKEDNYIEISSYTHHPFYKKFDLEVEDNWMWGDVYNVPVEDMMKIMDNALDNGYTIAWGADVSEKGFSWTNGIAIVPEENMENLEGDERSKWSKLTDREKKKLFYTFDKILKEKEITQEDRQKAFDNYTTTDDHGMQIVGYAKDQNGTKYYIVKNSWSENGSPYDGYFYASETFVKYKTMDFMIHKDAVPKDIAKKLDL